MYKNIVFADVFILANVRISCDVMSLVLDMHKISVKMYQNTESRYRSFFSTLIHVDFSHSWARLHSVMTNMTQILFYVITAITFHYWMLYNYIFLWSLEGKGSAKLKKDYKSVFSKWNWRSRNLSNSRCQTILTNDDRYQQVYKIFRWNMDSVIKWLKTKSPETLHLVSDSLPQAIIVCIPVIILVAMSSIRNGRH